MNRNQFASRDAHYYHLTVRIKSETVNINNPRSNLLENLYTIQQSAPTHSTYHAFVFMGDHFHLLIDLDGETPFHYPLVHSQVWKPIFSFAAYLETYKYIYRNPLAESLCSSPEFYPYSSLSWMLGVFDNPGLEIVDHLRVVQNPLKILSWIKGGESPFRQQVERYLW